jgi:hypothetical protein
MARMHYADIDLGAKHVRAGVSEADGEVLTVDGGFADSVF